MTRTAVDNPHYSEWDPDRRVSDSLRWKRYRDRDILAMWVADMDYSCAPPILEALHHRVDKGIFGYTAALEQANRTVSEWVQAQYNWTIQPEWIVWLPGLVPALHAVCRAFAKEDEQVLTFSPVYPPFLNAPGHSNRTLTACPLDCHNGRYTMNLDKLEAMLSENTKVLLLCSPHNPVGRIWSKDTLLKLAEICLKRNILICSDEIHCDLILDTQKQHFPTATLSEKIADNTITLMSAAKTFNISGLNCGFAIISNKKLRQQFKKSCQGVIPHVNTLGYTACQAAFSEGMPWLRSVLSYLRANHQLLYDSVNSIPKLSMEPVEATYLAWINIEKLNLADPVKFFEDAGVGLTDGADFGDPGHVRLNFACSRENLSLAIERIRKAVEEIG